MFKTIPQRTIRAPTLIPNTPSKRHTPAPWSKPLPSSPTPSHPVTTAKRHTALWGARKKASDENIANADSGRNIMTYLARGQRWQTWAPDALVRLMGERRSQKSAKHQSSSASRHQWLHNYYTNVMRKQFHDEVKYRGPITNWSEWWNYDPAAGSLQADKLGPDAIYKYKPTPFNIRFRHYAVHPRPIESNLTTGNEKVADQILPPDYMDKIFNQTDLGKPISERFTMYNPKLQYSLDTWLAQSPLHKVLHRLFHVALPHHDEPKNLAFGARRKFVGSNQIWMSGCWVDRRELNDFLQWLTLYTVGIPSIAIVKAKIDGERLNGFIINPFESTFFENPMTMRTRMIKDSDRTTKAQFEMIEGLPKMPLLD